MVACYSRGLNIDEPLAIDLPLPPRMASYDAKIPELMTSASFRPSSCGAQIPAVPNTELPRGRSSLYSSFQAPIFVLASNKFANQLAFRASF